MTERLDSLGSFAAAARMPELVAAAAETQVDTSGLPTHDDIEAVVALGMGSAGTAADLLAAVAGPFMAVPIVVHKGYDPPSFMNDSTMVLALSATGHTAEVLESASTALAAGSHLVAISREEGPLAELAISHGFPVFGTPDDLPTARAAFGPLAVTPLVVLDAVGLFPGALEWIARAVEQLGVRRDELVVDGGPAERLARRIGGTLPIVYGGGAIGAVAAQRWKTLFNENAKVAAFAGVLPEVCHNEIAGWGQHGDITRQVFTQIDLRHDHEHPLVMRRFELLESATAEVVARVEEVAAKGDGELAQLLDLALFGDFVSLHLAAQAGVDPGPIPAVTDIEEALGGA